MRRLTEAVISSNSTKRKTFVSARRSSFFDHEACASALAESELKLLSAVKSLELLEAQHKDLKAKYDIVLNQYTALKQDAIANVWCYCADKSADFCHLPRMDASVPELEGRLGDYDVCEIIGMGQFSTVKRGVRRSRHVPGSNGSSAGASADAAANAGIKKEGPEDESVLQLGSGSNRLVAFAASLAGTIESGIGSNDEAPVGTAVALKFLQKEKMTSIDTAKRVEAEIGALKLLAGHANIVKYYVTIHARLAVCIVTELLQTDLFDFLARSKDKMTEPVAACIARELVEALCHLQAHGIAHRDIKPENVLLDVSKSALTVKLCDFNLCCRVPEHSSMLAHFVGSPGFFAPESITAASYCAYKADVFSLGSVLLEVASSASFFLHHWLAAYKLISTAEAPSFFPSIKQALREAEKDLRASQHCSKDCLEFVQHCLTLQPSLRLSAPRLKDLSFVKRASRVAAADALHDRVRRFIDLPTAGPDTEGPLAGEGDSQPARSSRGGSRGGSRSGSRGGSSRGQASRPGGGGKPSSRGSTSAGQFAMIPPFSSPSHEEVAPPSTLAAAVPTSVGSPAQRPAKTHRSTIAIVRRSASTGLAFEQPFSPISRSPGALGAAADGDPIRERSSRPSSMLSLAANSLDFFRKEGAAPEGKTSASSPVGGSSSPPAAVAKAPVSAWRGDAGSHPAFQRTAGRRGSIGGRLLV